MAQLAGNGGADPGKLPEVAGGSVRAGVLLYLLNALSNLHTFFLEPEKVLVISTISLWGPLRGLPRRLQNLDSRIERLYVFSEMVLSLKRRACFQARAILCDQYNTFCALSFLLKWLSRFSAAHGNASWRQQSHTFVTS